MNVKSATIRNGITKEMQDKDEDREIVIVLYTKKEPLRLNGLLGLYDCIL